MKNEIYRAPKTVKTPKWRMVEHILTLLTLLTLFAVGVGSSVKAARHAGSTGARFEGKRPFVPRGRYTAEGRELCWERACAG